MNASVNGTVVHGGLELDQPLRFPDRCRVRVVVQAIDAGVEDWNIAFQEFQALCNTRPINSGGQRFTREELHELR